MKRNILTIIGLTTTMGLSAAFGPAASAQPATSLRPDMTVLLYADEFTDQADPVRGAKIVSAGYHMIEGNGLTEGEYILDNGNIGRIGEDARFDLYFPAKPNGQMVVCCPGGGYSIVSSYNEGVYVAEWMLERGITVAVVKYRLPNRHHNVPLEDVQNVFRYCRAHASEWGVRQIGVMGFSAGGHLAVTTSVMYEDAATRPDFSVFIYPVVTVKDISTHTGTHNELVGIEAEALSREGKSWEEWQMSKNIYRSLEQMYSLEDQTSPDNPPAFIALCSDDRSVNPENSIRLYTSLLRDGVPVEMHIYPTGGHGWGFSAEKYVGVGNDKLAYCRDQFYAALERWLAAQLAGE